MLEHARQFLERVMPPGIGDGAYLNVHWSGVIPDGPRQGQKFWDGRACTSINEAIRVIQWVNTHGDKDIYVCMSLQAKREEKTSAKGNTYYKALRLADDVAGIRSLYVDIDVKEGAYPTTQAALQALKVFLDATGIPIPSAVVMSGSGGFHCHWALDRVLDRNTWQFLADALSNAVQQHGVHCDTQCTVDAARILRVPGTWNRKYEIPHEVTLFSLGSEVSLGHMVSVLRPYDRSTVSRAPKIAANDELGAGIEPSKVEVSADEVAKQCPFIARTLRTGGKDNDQPLWFLTASLSTFMQNGRDVFHAMSDQHPGYDAKATDELFDRVTQTQKDRDLGWPTCRKIASYGCKECATCPLLQNDKSPLHFAIPTAAIASTPANDLPDGFVRGTDGRVMARFVNEDGTPGLVPVCPYPIFDGWLIRDPWELHVKMEVEPGKRITASIPVEVTGGAGDGFAKLMGRNGIALMPAGYKLLKEFMVAWISKLQKTKEKVVASTPFGWAEANGKDIGFAYGGRMWGPDGDIPAANPDVQLAHQYNPKGDPKYWRELADMQCEQKRPQTDAILAVAFAGPLVKATGFPGLILNAYSSESGIGKTTAMKTAQAVWAAPTQAMQSLNDTSNSVLGKMGKIRSMPVFWDEIKSEQQVKTFCSIVFNLSGGREKTRMNADGSLRMSGDWHTMLVSASNESLVSYMAVEVGSTTAGIHRLFEFVVPPAKTAGDPAMVQRLIGRLDSNHGHIGLEYAKWLGRNAERIDREVGDLQTELFIEANATHEERYWIATVAVLVKGAMYANELGFTNIDVDALRKFLVGNIDRMRREVQQSGTDLTDPASVAKVLSEFLDEARALHTLVTNRLFVGTGRPLPGVVSVVGDTSRMREVWVHRGRDDNLVRINQDRFKRWMMDRHKQSPDTFLSKAESYFGMVRKRLVLGSGTDYAGAQVYTLQFDLDDPRIAPFFTD